MWYIILCFWSFLFNFLFVYYFVLRLVYLVSIVCCFRFVINLFSFIFVVLVLFIICDNIYSFFYGSYFVMKICVMICCVFVNICCFWCNKIIIYSFIYWFFNQYNLFVWFNAYIWIIFLIFFENIFCWFDVNIWCYLMSLLILFVIFFWKKWIIIFE